MVVSRAAPPTATLEARIDSLGHASDLDALGIFHVPAGVFHDRSLPPDIVSAHRLFLPRLSDGDALSRGDRYYDVRSSLLAWPTLVAACSQLSRSDDDRYDVRLRRALYENLFNVAAAMTFSYWEVCCDEPERFADEGPVLAALVDILPELARLHLAVILDGDQRPVPRIDWELLHWIGTHFPPGRRLRKLREFDNKARVLNEVLYLLSDVRRRWPFDVVLFPMYGALTLAAYFSAVQPVVGSGRHEAPLLSLLVRLGMYDRGPASYVGPDGQTAMDSALPRPWLGRAKEAMSGHRVLVVDDNAATGGTLRACRDLVLQCGGVPRTRSAETSWELLARKQPDERCLEDVDFPGLRSNLSHALQCTLVDLLLRRQWDRYVATVDRLCRTAFPTRVLENYRLAKTNSAWRPHQQDSIEHERAFALLYWREPGYPSGAAPPGRLAWEHFPDGVWAGSMSDPAGGRAAGGAAGTSGLKVSVLGPVPPVLAAGTRARVRVVREVVKGTARPEPFRIRLGEWSARLDLASGPVDVDVEVPETPGSHHLTLRADHHRGPAPLLRCPVHVVRCTPVHASVTVVGAGCTADALARTGAQVVEGDASDLPVVFGEGALGPATRALLCATLDRGGTALVLAQDPCASGCFPMPARIESVPQPDRSIRFTTSSPAVPSLPRHRVLTIEDDGMVASSVVTRIGTGPWAADLAIGQLCIGGLFRGTLVGAQPVGPGRLIVCQLRVVAPAVAGRAGACALLADLLRWAVAPSPPLTREDAVCPDGRSMSFYPYRGARE